MRSDQRCHLLYLIFTNDFEQNDGDCIIDHSLAKDDGEELGLHDWTYESESGYWIGCRYCCWIFYDQADIHVLIGFILSNRDDPLEFIYKVGQSKNGTKGNDGSKKSKEKDVLEVSLEILFFEVVASCKDHGW